jgi:hypothetical protein
MICHTRAPKQRQSCSHNAHCLTAVDRFTRWPEVIPITDITADTVARALLTGWISRFGCPQTITTDQGRQFESQLFKSLANMCGIQLLRTTNHQPQQSHHLQQPPKSRRLPLQKQRATVVKYMTPLASTSEQPSPRGGGVGTSQTSGG